MKYILRSRVIRVKKLDVEEVKNISYNHVEKEKN